MKILPKILFSVLFLLTGVLTSGFVSSPDKTGKYCPQYEGTITIPGLKDSVMIYRDERGIPHIYATCEHDLYLATGYVTAQERLWQMDLVRRSTSGRLAELFGKNYRETDILARCLRIREKSEQILKNEDPEIVACLQAYADGVNAFIDEPGKKLPFEFRLLSYKPEPWTLADITSIIGLMGWNLASKNLEDELFNYDLVLKAGAEKASEMIPDWEITPQVVYPDFQLDDTLISEVRTLIASHDRIDKLGVTASSGSNNWAVAGKKSETGKPLLSNDMHLSLSNPGIWIQMHQVVPGKLDVTGVMIPGEPFIVAGHNECIAWGLSNLCSDDIDLYAERINPENPDQYLFNGGWKDIIRTNEIITVKHGEQDTVTIRFTHRGPILSGLLDIKNTSLKTVWTGYEFFKDMIHIGDVSLSMRWTGNNPSDEVRSIYLVNRAKGWDDFRSALSTFRSISQNFVYADTSGNIGLQAAAGIPVRKGNGIMIRGGETDEYDWKGMVPFEQLPFSFNPENGQVSSANNRTVSSDYPYFISQDYFLPYRINRIRQMLDEKVILGLDDFKRMLNDQHFYLAGLLTPYILRLKERMDELSALEVTALDILSGWDYDMNASLTAPTIFEFFRISLKRNLLADELGDLFEHLNYLTGEYYVYRIITEKPDGWIDNINTAETETLDDILMQSFKDCMGELVNQFGKNPENWKWGKIHTVTFAHPIGSVRVLNWIYDLNSPEFGVGGSDQTVCPYFSFEPGFKAVNGASMRYICNTADWDESYSVIPGGISGVPGSEFYLSQAQTYIEGKFYKDHFSDEAVRASSKYTLVLRPGK